MATYTVDLFTTLDGFGTGPVGYWGKDGPELREERAGVYGDEDQTLVLGANTFRLMTELRPGGGRSEPLAAQRGPQDRDLADARGAADTGGTRR